MAINPQTGLEEETFTTPGGTIFDVKQDEPVKAEEVSITEPSLPEQTSASVDTPIVDKDPVEQTDTNPEDIPGLETGTSGQISGFAKSIIAGDFGEQGLQKGQALDNRAVSAFLKSQFNLDDATINAIITQRDIETGASDAEKKVESQAAEAITSAEEIFRKDLETETIRIKEKGQRVIDTTQRLNSLRGAGRGSVNEKAILAQETAISGLISAAERKSDLALQLRTAEIENASIEVKTAIQEAKAKNQVILNEEIEKAALIQEELNEELGASFKESMESAVDLLEISGEDISGIDLLKSETLGYFVNEDGSVYKNNAGNPVVYKKPAGITEKDISFQFIPATSDNVTGEVIQPAGYFNKATGEFKPITFGGTEGSSEFPSVNQKIAKNGKVQVAEYTQIYKGSSANPEGVDLAGKKGSAINTPIAGEVIFVGENGGWGNQVKIRDAEGNIHQFSHLDGSALSEGQVLSAGSMIGTMGNTGNVLKGDGTKPTEEELASGRGTHLDYTVLDSDGKKQPLATAMAYLGLDNTTGEVSNTQTAFDKGYDNATRLKIYNKIIKEGGTPLDLKGANLNSEQSKSVGFATRMSNDLDIMKLKEDSIKDLGVLKLAFYRRSFGTELGNQYVPEKVQQYLQAERDFISAQLRKESGAAIPPEEITSFIKTNGVLPGDSAATIKQKRNNMELMLEGMISTAGAGSTSIDAILDKQDEDFLGGNNATGDIEFDKQDEDFFNNL